MGQHAEEAVMVEFAPGVLALQGEIRRRRVGRSAGAWGCGGGALDGVALWWRVSVCVVVGCVALALCLARAEGARASGWAVQPTPGPRGGALLSMSCTSPAVCIAVGSSSAGRPAKVLAERWDGRRWSIQRTPNPRGAVSSRLSGVSCTSARACSAVGTAVFVQSEAPLVERWNGSKWSIQLTPSPGLTAGLAGVSCPSRRFCVAVGFVFVGPSGDASALAERWNGRRWSIQQSPNPKPNPGLGGPTQNSFAGVSCTSSRFCIAVGVAGAPEIGTGSTLAEGWNGSKWSIQQTQNPSDLTHDDALSGVSCTSTSACTAVGTADVGEGVFQPDAQRWNGRRWSLQLPTPNPAANLVETSLSINGVSCASRTACTSVGSFFDNAGSSVTLAEGWNGLRWAVQRTPRLGQVLSGASCTSTTVCFAVGASRRGPLAERFTGPNPKRSGGLG
jgi:hypothetical protein